MPEFTITQLAALKRAGEKIAVLTAYDASFARQAEAAGVEALLVGDSLGMVVQGEETTLPVSLDDMVYHTRLVSRAVSQPLVIADLPFLSYPTPTAALASAARLMKEGGAHMVKLEGGANQCETVAALARHAVPVCAHLGLQPQSVLQLGGYRVQGRDAEAAQAITEDAQALQAAGAQLLVLECVPRDLAAAITARLQIPVIGIGAGAGCDGQVLVLYDMLGITTGHRPIFVEDFLARTGSIAAALRAYVQAVKAGEFPTDAQSYA